MPLLHAGPSWLWALVAGAAITALILLGGFGKIQQVFKLLCLALLSYVVVLFTARVPWRTVGVNTLIPHVTWSRDYLTLLVLGTTISPYLFFWQTANRVEEIRLEDAGGAKPLPLARRTTLGAKGKTRSSRFDVFTGMFPSNLIMFAIITATAATLGLHRGQDITSAAQAAGALKPAAGSLASVLCYLLIAAGTLGGTALTLSSVNPITLLVLVAGVNGIAVAPFLIVVMIISRSRRLMGDSRNGGLAAVLGWFTVALMTAAAIAMLALLTGV